MSEVRVAYFESERRELVGLNYAETVRSPLLFAGHHGSMADHRAAVARDASTAPPARDIDALGYVGYFAELLDEWAQEADADDRLYRLGASMLDALAAGAPVEPLARYFEYWLLRLQGVYPEARGTLSDGAMAFLERSRALPPQQIGAAPADARVLRELENSHRALIATHLEKTLRSDRVLREMRRHSETC
jgi:hypothetical protein